MILPANDRNLSPNVPKPLPQIIVGIEQSLASLVNQVNISEIQGCKIHFTARLQTLPPVQVINHRLEFLQLLDAELVLVKQPHGARGEVVSGARLGQVLPVLAGRAPGDQSLFL